MLFVLATAAALRAPATRCAVATRVVAARHAPLTCVAAAAGAYSSDDWDGESWTDEEDDDDDDDGDASRRWLNLANCDVLPPPPGQPCAGVRACSGLDSPACMRIVQTTTFES